jgi:hypothetical protein
MNCHKASARDTLIVGLLLGVSRNGLSFIEQRLYDFDMSAALTPGPF